MDSRGRARELVYCHQCEEEWHRDEHGLTCPSCHSEFIEIIDQTHDPREDPLHFPPGNEEDDDPPLSVPPRLSPNPLRDHNPWANTPEPGDHGPQVSRIQWRSTGPHSFHVTGTFVRNISPRGGDPHTPQMNNDPFASLLSSFGTMMQTIAAGNAQGGQGTLGGGPSIQNRTGSGPGYTFRATSRLMPRDANQPQMDMPVDDLHRLLGETLFGGPRLAQARDPNARGEQPNDPSANAGVPPNPLFGLLMPLLNPALAASGDAVYTQEAFDRVMSQLMEQNNMGSAPGPAPQDAIRALPKVRVTKDMLDPKTGQADCSICMDSVDVGGEVTRLWCGHWFHGECVGSWLREHDSCPQCRKGLVQARDEAMGNAGPNAATAATTSATAATAGPGSANANGAPPQPPRNGRRTSSSSYSNRHHIGASGATSPISNIPGGFGYSDASSRNQTRRPSGSRHGSVDGSSGEQQSTGFADRVRGLFGRGSGGGQERH